MMGPTHGLGSSSQRPQGLQEGFSFQPGDEQVVEGEQRFELRINSSAIFFFIQRFLSLDTVCIAATRARGHSLCEKQAQDRSPSRSQFFFFFFLSHSIRAGLSIFAIFCPSPCPR